MPVDWEALARRADDAVDETFGHGLNLTDIIPWNTSGADAYSAGGRDEARPIIENIPGVFKAKAAEVNDFADMAGTNSKMAEQGITFSVQTRYLGQTRQGDRVWFKNRGLRTEIALISPGDSGRSLLQLLRIKAGQM